ncbi:MAG TPA: (2Fe-2S)-binding protein [Alphaproteobacteria bacterium]|jgi:aerobic-type carbon monoxide dehydrogenase small subunit (CoxS/CutS family)|nr:(2Fe-2S)-binding protein [Alphaproteobacteria bacterium]MDP6270068.1 (2Fe-2S)-binding protein [Alphaproteobacteria bacterium]MDP7164513.1 (2Fe-2S)-binding protein [Alphaproteobacteria bacterium]MDP7427145.1 (2Fe-2S)-binding protein [Alphaproteobacteria bacterium]HJM52295.1 (2Fe-2S)-binding protein [Alphaproteobacteria bacterium]|tara:strand:- start:1118 stop:1591 length:474 start_codon:yes stop_codon:yes gene_type:complete
MNFSLNGRPVVSPSAMDDDPLLYVLRDGFGLLGPKFGCGVGACGACTVLVDGAAERSCQLTPKDVDGRTIVTLEGLGAGRRDGLHAVQRAWIEASVPQCGYCQNGQIMTAAALLAADPKAGPETIAAAMDGVICRCGTQARIRQAIALVQANGGRDM